MSRTFWFVAGAATSAYAITKARRAAEALTPDGFRDRLAGLSRGAQLFGEEVRSEMTVKETELRERLGLRLDGPRQVESQTDAAPVAPLQLTRKGNS
jgi:hypothetical protein